MLFTAPHNSIEFAIRSSFIQKEEPLTKDKFPHDRTKQERESLSKNKRLQVECVHRIPMAGDIARLEGTDLDKECPDRFNRKRMDWAEESDVADVRTVAVPDRARQ